MNDKISDARQEKREKRLWWVGFFIILALAAATRFYRLGAFPHPVFDEVYYATMASQYIAGIPFADAHPPAARFVFAALAKIGGAHGNERFPKTSNSFGDFPYVLLRGGSAAAGVAVVLFLMLIGKTVTGSGLVGLTAGFLAVLDNALALESRLMLGDVFILAFGLAGFWAFLRALAAPFPSRAWSGWAVSAGVLLGLSAGAKVSGLIFAGAAWFAWLIHPQARGSGRRAKLAVAAVLLLLPLFMIFALEFAHFAILAPSGSVLNVIGAKEGAGNMPIFDKLRDGRLEEMFGEFPGLLAQRTLEALLGSFLAVGAHFGDFSPHSAAAPWYAWPFMETPISFAADRAPGGYRIIELIGNPAVWWGGFFMLIAVLVRGARTRSLFGTEVFIFGYLLNLFVLALAPRELFVYHYLPSLVFLILITAAALEQLGKNHPRLFAAFVVAVLAAFLFFAPFTYGLPLTQGAVKLRVWLPSWNPLD